MFIKTNGACSLTNVRVFIAGIGIISPLGRGRQATLAALQRGDSAIKPVRLFPVFQTNPLPVGEIEDSCLSIGESIQTETVPRTHLLALLAAQEAVAEAHEPPDAILLGVASGGMPTTETLLKEKVTDPARYRYHALGSVATHIAHAVRCRGPVLTVSTACSSGSVALAIAVEMLKRGKARSVLAGGADALCRMTYYGFHALQLVDTAGARPLDRNRRGMTVGEGAAMLLLIAAETPPNGVLGEILGAGLSCDAYHPAAPQPDGLGALHAMQDALGSACMRPSEIDYIHLHGTGTIDNDLAEARAINTLFGLQTPLLSSTKGATGHTLGAAGAIGAAIAAFGICEGLVPASTACHDPDPELKLLPVMKPLQKTIRNVLVNAFGFGGNNASLVIGKRSLMYPHPGRGERGCDDKHESAIDKHESAISRKVELNVHQSPPLYITGMSCLTGAGDASATITRLMDGDPVKGILNFETLAVQLPQKVIRRLKRLPRMVLTLAAAACADRGGDGLPHAVFFGTGWGPLSEAHDFLMKLFESGEQFTSPTDFIGAVHNAPAGQVAMQLKATGPNITLSGGDYSFEQALFTAELFLHEPGRPLLVVGADEYHSVFSPLFEPASVSKDPPADGGAAFLLTPGTGGGVSIRPLFLNYADGHPQVMMRLIGELGGPQQIRDRYSAIFAGIPATYDESGRKQLDEFLSFTGFGGPVIDYRRWIGEFASASAIAAFLAVQCVQHFELLEKMHGQKLCSLSGRGILLLGLGDFVTAVEVMP